MKDIALVKFGKATQAFELREKPTPEPKSDEVLIKSEGFGLNFADVMARLGLYPACPPLPAVVGYENVGIIEKVGTHITSLKVGDRVLAFTRFGGYADHIISKENAVAKIPAKFSIGEATALATQYITAWYAVNESAVLHEGDNVLVHAAAGGVGTALVQLLKMKKCVVFGTASKPEKLTYLKSLGVDYPINYKSHDYVEEIKKLGFNKKIDLAINPVGADYVKKDLSLLRAGGREILFGASKFTDAKNIFQKIAVLLSFGKIKPMELLSQSKSLVGLNMLEIADNKPEVFQRGLMEIISLAEKGIIQPTVGKEFNYSDIAAAHDYLGSRSSMGKVAVKW
ncbi:MAG: zinc-binding dehydrogenase [Cyclobacteriaceae bacterium]